jgi:sortase (surface protein transpeptidase)
MMTRERRRRGKDKKQKGKAAMIVAGLLLAAGIALVCYPSASRAVYRTKARRMNEAFLEQTQTAYTPEEWEALYQRMVQYNQTLYETGQGRLVDAFAYEQVDFSLKEYGFEQEMIGYLSIPRLEQELPIFLGAGSENLARGAGHLTQTSLPVGGENTNAVIAAHRGMATADMFRHIDKLEKGDMLYLTNFRETLQ